MSSTIRLFFVIYYIRLQWFFGGQGEGNKVALGITVSTCRRCFQNQCL
jgi:hypothetical protein